MTRSKLFNETEANTYKTEIDTVTNIRCKHFASATSTLPYNLRLGRKWIQNRGGSDNTSSIFLETLTCPYISYRTSRCSDLLRTVPIPDMLVFSRFGPSTISTRTCLSLMSFVEWLFLATGPIVTKKRNALAANRVEGLLFLSTVQLRCCSADGWCMFLVVGTAATMLCSRLLQSELGSGTICIYLCIYIYIYVLFFEGGFCGIIQQEPKMGK